MLHAVTLKVMVSAVLALVSVVRRYDGMKSFVEDCR